MPNTQEYRTPCQEIQTDDRWVVSFSKLERADSGSKSQINNLYVEVGLVHINDRTVLVGYV